MGGYHILKIIHLCSIGFWSTFVCFYMNQDVKWVHWLAFIGMFIATLASGTMLLMTQGLHLSSSYPSWVYIKYAMVFVLFAVGGLSLSKKGLKSRWHYLIFLLLFLFTNVISVFKPYL